MAKLPTTPLNQATLQAPPIPAKPSTANLPKDPNARKAGEFIIIIRAQKGTLHAALDEKNKGPGALFVYPSAAAAKAAAQGNEVCSKLKYYILELA